VAVALALKYPALVRALVLASGYFYPIFRGDVVFLSGPSLPVIGDIMSHTVFLAANPAFLTMFGYSSEELQQLSFLDTCIDEARDECRVPLGELRDGARFQYEIETQHRRKDGTSLPVNTYFSSISERGPNQRTFLTVTVDISARRAAEDALRAAQSELRGRTADNSRRDRSDNREET
jgi:PAS domain S-box-containing protein